MKKQQKKLIALSCILVPVTFNIYIKELGRRISSGGKLIILQDI